MSKERPASGGTACAHGEQTYLVPFGRYEGSRSAEYPANEVLVGREKQRATLLNHLFTAGRRGAYLITGHRGSGKTSFAQHCLDEYGGDVYRRFLQRNIGRAFLWDRVVQLLVSGVLIAAGLVLSQVLIHLIETVLVPPDPPAPRVLAVVAVVALTIVLGYPFVAAYRTFADALRFADPRREQPPDGGLLSQVKHWFQIAMSATPSLGPFVFTLAATLAALLWTSRVDPAIGMAQVLIVVATFFTLCQLLSISFTDLSKRGKNRGGPTDDPTVAVEPVPAKPWRLRQWSPYLAFAIPSTFLSWPGANEPTEQVGEIVVFHIATAAFILGIGMLLRSWHQHLFHGRLSIEYPAGRNRAEGQKAVLTIVRSSSTWLLLAAVLAAGVAIPWSREFITKRSEYRPDLWILSTVLLLTALHTAFITVRLWSFQRRRTRLRSPYPAYPWMLVAYAKARLTAIWTRDRTKSERRHSSLFLPGWRADNRKNYPFIRFHPRPSGLLLLRALTMVTFGVQLLFPVVNLVLQITVGIDLSTTTNVLESSQYSLFTTPGVGEGLWIGCVVLLLLVFSGIEFDWIICPYANMREDFALHKAMEKDREDYPRFSEVRERCLTIARQTIFWKVCTAWLPVLRIPVNLGFDSLDQRVVIEAMLVGLRDAYRRTFLHWSSVFTAVRRGLGILILLMITQWAGDHLFLPDGDTWKLILAQKEVCTDNRLGESTPQGQFDATIDGSPPLHVGINVSSEEETQIPAELPPGIWLTCKTLGEPGVQLLQWCPFCDQRLLAARGKSPPAA